MSNMALLCGSRFLFALVFLCLGVDAATRFYHFKIDYLNVTRICHTKVVPVVNGKFPGPTIRVRDGDNVLVNVTNLVKSNMTIHWHGVHQRRSGWMDGPAYITQCPIQTGKSFLYNFTIQGQQDTFFWHAHISWLRSTVYGAFIIEPKRGHLLPYPKPYADRTMLLGEWWNEDIETLVQNISDTGTAPSLSDAYFINGLPGAFFNCSEKDITIVNVKPEKTYLLRVISNTHETDIFITIANHSIIMVATDGSYTKPSRRDTVLVSPGQTFDLLVTADQPIGQYYIIASDYDRQISNGVPKTSASAILRYHGANLSSTPVYPDYVPLYNNLTLLEISQNMTRSLNSKEHPSLVPHTVDVSLYYVLSLNTNPCDKPNKTSQCQGPGGGISVASINNVTFQTPTKAMLEAYYLNVSGVYTTDFPHRPQHPWNYTSGTQSLFYWPSQKGARVTEIPFGANVQLVLQGTVTQTAETHPIHLHGTDFYVVGSGKGNYNESRDSHGFNLVDPPKRSTVKTVQVGWIAIRWKADNPGMWLLHCHFDIHAPTWGMETAFLVKKGIQPNQTLEPPPNDMPTC